MKLDQHEDVDFGEIKPESEWSPPTTWCPHPQRWHSTDTDSTEIEVSVLFGAFTQAQRTDWAVETGTAFGQSAHGIGAAMKHAGYGQLITYETDPVRVDYARKRVEGLPVSVMERSSLEGLAELAHTHAGQVGFVLLDSTFENRPQEFVLAVPLLATGGVIAVHDCAWPALGKYPKFSSSMWAVAREYDFSGVSLATPRGVTFFSRSW